MAVRDFAFQTIHESDRQTGHPAELGIIGPPGRTQWRLTMPNRHLTNEPVGPTWAARLGEVCSFVAGCAVSLHLMTPINLPVHACSVLV